MNSTLCYGAAAAAAAAGVLQPAQMGLFLMAQDTDDTLSGTTAVCVLIRGREVTICNVGDSRCVAAESRGAELVAVDLTQDQTPYR
jgi:serine/threonine protein phosphatase PrpC